MSRLGNRSRDIACGYRVKTSAPWAPAEEGASPLDRLGGPWDCQRSPSGARLGRRGSRCRSGRWPRSVRIEDTAAGFTQLMDLLAVQVQGCETPIPVAIETAKGPLVANLRAPWRTSLRSMCVPGTATHRPGAAAKGSPTGRGQRPAPVLDAKYKDGEAGRLPASGPLSSVGVLHATRGQGGAPDLREGRGGAEGALRCPGRRDDPLPRT